MSLKNLIEYLFRNFVVNIEKIDPKIKTYLLSVWIYFFPEFLKNNNYMREEVEIFQVIPACI